MEKVVWKCFACGEESENGDLVCCVGYPMQPLMRFVTSFVTKAGERNLFQCPVCKSISTSKYKESSCFAHDEGE